MVIALSLCLWSFLDLWKGCRRVGFCFLWVFVGLTPWSMKSELWFFWMGYWQNLKSGHEKPLSLSRPKEDKKSLNQKILILKLNRSGKSALVIVNRAHKSSPDLEKVALILMKLHLYLRKWVSLIVKKSTWPKKSATILKTLLIKSRTYHHFDHHTSLHIFDKKDLTFLFTL